MASKYTQGQLKEMASAALLAEANNDPRWNELCYELTIRQLLLTREQLTEEEIIARLAHLAYS